MLAILALLVGGVTAYALVRGVGERSSADVVQAAPVAEMTFEPEVITHSPEFLAREKEAAKAAPVVKATPIAKPAQPSAAKPMPVAPKPAPPAPKPAAPTQGGKSMSKLQRIMELQDVIKGDSSAGKTKTKAEQTELQKLASDVAAELKQPVYPPGMRAQFGKRDATIMGATQDAQGVWHYTIDLKSGEFLGLGSGTYNKTEAEVRAAISSELGAMGTGQSFPRGITVMRNGKGGTIQSASQDPKTGEWQYQITGWPNAVAQSELTATMRAA